MELVWTKAIRKTLELNVIAFYKRIGFKQLNDNLSILIRQFGIEISIVSIYINDFCITSNTMTILDEIRASFSKKYDVKDLRKVKIIIGQ